MGQLSELARKGSGSAARSIFGGFAEMKTGHQPDGSDAIAYPMQDENYWDICVIIAITSETQKKIGSTAGMNLTASTSPYYREWVNSAPDDLKEMKKAILEKNFPLLGELSEYSCLKMHGLAMSARPGLIYWNKTTLDCIQQIRKLRDSNVPVYFTIDAGPQVKALCLQKDKETVEQALQGIDGVHRTITTVMGPAASIVEILD
jgi:diphosphomevalonate decarboxylase